VNKAISAPLVCSIQNCTVLNKLGTSCDHRSFYAVATDSPIRSRHPSGFAWRRTFKMRRQTLAAVSPPQNIFGNPSMSTTFRSLHL
jgi:hypothetical protein